MVSLRQLEVLNCILEGSSSLNQEGTRPQRMSMSTRSEESASCKQGRGATYSDTHPTNVPALCLSGATSAVSVAGRER